MKNKHLLMVVLFVFSIINGCSQDEGSDNLKVNGKEITQEDTKPAKQETESVTEGHTIVFEGVSFDLPEDFEELELTEEQTQGMPAKLFVLSDQSASVNLVVEEVPQGMNFEEYMDAATSATGFQYESKNSYNKGGRDWSESVSMNNGLKLNQRTVVNNGIAYIFTYSSLPENYEANLDVFKKITDSIKFAD